MVITVGRQYGSGGREIGTALANKLGIAYYDDLLLKKAAEESGLCEELFHSFDERPKSFLYSIAMDPYSFTMHHVTPKGSIEQQVYLATYDTIKRLADKASRRRTNPARRTITTIPRRTGAKPRATTCASTRRFSASRGRSRCSKSW